MIVYHVGFLWADRINDLSVNVKAWKWWKKYERGEVYLLQRRISPGVCEYIAVPRKVHDYDEDLV